MVEPEGIVAVVGPGRMGTQVAKALSRYSPLIYGRSPTPTWELAQMVGGWATCQLETLAMASKVFLVLPPRETVPFVQQLVPHLRRWTLLVNLATDVMTKDIREAIGDPPVPVELAAVKIVGAAPSLEQGIEALIVVDAESEDTAKMLAEMMNEFGLVMFGKEGVVSRANVLTTQQVLRACRNISKTLEAEGVPPAIIRTVIKSVGAGIVHVYATGRLGTMSRRILEDLEREEQEAKKSQTGG